MRKQYSVAFKATLVLELLKENKSLAHELKAGTFEA